MSFPIAKKLYFLTANFLQFITAADTAKPSPIVFVFHGAGGSGDEIADRSGWAYVAQKYGFIIVCPSASNPNRVRNVSNMVTNEMFRSMWNTGNPQQDRPSDYVFLDYLYAWVTENYNIDKSRVYASGQSSGGMMSWGCAAYRADYFAAVAPNSAKIYNMETEAIPPLPGSITPIISFLGIEDGAFPGGYATDDAKELIDYWCERNHLVEKWDTFTYNDGAQNCSYKEGLFTNYVYKTKNGVPLLRCIEVDTKAHAIWPSECEMIWNEWFTQFSKNPDSLVLFYKDKPVEI